jgi:hypothetical protein
MLRRFISMSVLSSLTLSGMAQQILNIAVQLYAGLILLLQSKDRKFRIVCWRRTDWRTHQ